MQSSPCQRGSYCIILGTWRRLLHKKFHIDHPANHGKDQDRIAGMDPNRENGVFSPFFRLSFFFHGFPGLSRNNTMETRIIPIKFDFIFSNFTCLLFSCLGFHSMSPGPFQHGRFFLCGEIASGCRAGYATA